MEAAAAEWQEAVVEYEVLPLGQLVEAQAAGGQAVGGTEAEARAREVMVAVDTEEVEREAVV